MAMVMVRKLYVWKTGGVRRENDLPVVSERRGRL
jgi:hypothetical protein